MSITTNLYNYNHVTGAGTTVIHASNNLVLQTIVVNTAGGAGSKVTIYDNSAASGNIIAVIDSSTYLGTYKYQSTVRKGITVVTTGASLDITVVSGPANYSAA